MLIYPQISTTFFKMGIFTIHWYGVMYFIGFLIAWWLAKLRNPHTFGWDSARLSDLIFYGMLGVIIGGRVGYMLFYATKQLWYNPLTLFKIWEGGMSFHGGLIGVAIALWLFAWRYKVKLLQLYDFAAPLAPLGLFFGRIGNFINGELWGRPTAVPWGMVFPAVDDLPRHPSQLYEALLEGVFLFAIVWLFSSKQRAPGKVTGVFLCGYSVVRIIVEFFREPDLHLGFIATSWLTLGQLLSLPMLLLGILLLCYPAKRER